MCANADHAVHDRDAIVAVTIVTLKVTFFAWLDLQDRSYKARHAVKVLKYGRERQMLQKRIYHISISRLNSCFLESCMLSGAVKR